MPIPPLPSVPPPLPAGFQPIAVQKGAALSLRGVGKAFGGNVVIKGCDLEIAAGQFVVVIGESGSGKSTLLRLVAGLEAPDRGEIVLRPPAGTDRVAETRLVFQEPRLLPWARVGANVAVGLPAATGTAEAQARVEAVLAEVGLARRAGDWPSVLSGGEKQRVALARALVTTPDLLLFDEPLGALDALTRLAMQTLIGRVWATLGFTALFVTHDVGEAVALADRVLVLAGGRIALDLEVPLDRPRERSQPQFGELEAVLLDAIFSAGGA